MPVSNTTIHGIGIDFDVPPCDILNCAIKIAIHLGTTIVGFYMQRAGSNVFGEQLDDRQNPEYTPSGHVYIAIPPGHNSKLVALCEAMDKLCFQTGPPARTGQLVVSARTAFQLSRRELIVYGPGEPGFMQRYVLTGPKYGMECSHVAYRTDLDNFPWNYYIRNLSVKSWISRIAERYTWDICNHMMVNVLSPTQYRLGRPQSVFQYECEDVERTGRSVRERTFGGPMRVELQAPGARLLDAGNEMVNLETMLDGLAGITNQQNTFTQAPPGQQQVPGPISVPRLDLTMITSNVLRTVANTPRNARDAGN
jgi:hypothetical protein